MEFITETNQRAVMGEKKLLRQSTGRDYIEYCTTAMEIRPTMLAALLGVTERTLNNWSEVSLDKSSSGKIARLLALADIINAAEEHGIKGKVIINLLNEPIPEDKEKKTLLYYVVDEPENKLLMTAAVQVIDSFK